jgi:DNA invertase Pin-like site-specific DNA recombinase
MALAQRSKAKGVSTSRTAMVGGEWRDLHSDIRYPPAPCDREGVIVKTVALYLRVSTREQKVENQRRELLAVCERRGWHVVAEFCDNGVSGAKGATSGRGSLAYIGRHPPRVHIVAAWSVDRLGRLLQDLVTFLGELQGAAVDLCVDRQGVDTSTPAGKALFQMLDVFAAFERSIIQERLAAAIARARAKGTRSGKAFGRPSLSAERAAAVRAALAEGIGIRRTARLVGTGNATPRRRLRARHGHHLLRRAQPRGRPSSGARATG